MVRRLAFYFPLLFAAALLMAGVQMHAQGAKIYKTRLAPMPVPAFTPTVVGSGSVTATLTGTKLAVAGTFEGLNTAATAARVHKSPKPGIRGPVLFELTVTKGQSGTINGALDLTAAQVQELGQGRYYVQLHSEKAPDGNLWGWLQEARK
jgi:hypothetical protein